MQNLKNKNNNRRNVFVNKKKAKFEKISKLVNKKAFNKWNTGKLLNKSTRVQFSFIINLRLLSGSLIFLFIFFSFIVFQYSKCCIENCICLQTIYISLHCFKCFLTFIQPWILQFRCFNVANHVHSHNFLVVQGWKMKSISSNEHIIFPPRLIDLIKRDFQNFRNADLNRYNIQVDMAKVPEPCSWFRTSSGFDQFRAKINLGRVYIQAFYTVVNCIIVHEAMWTSLKFN